MLATNQTPLNWTTLKNQLTYYSTGGKGTSIIDYITIAPSTNVLHSSITKAATHHQLAHNTCLSITISTGPSPFFPPTQELSCTKPQPKFKLTKLSKEEKTSLYATAGTSHPAPSLSHLWNFTKKAISQFSKALNPPKSPPIILTTKLPRSREAPHAALQTSKVASKASC